MPYKDPNDPRRRQALRKGSAKHYANNKEKVLKTTRNNKQKNKKKWLEFKSSLGCKFCGENHPAALDFHHEDPQQKDREVSYYIKNHQYGRAMEEVKKCIVLCANCHRILHFNELALKRKKKKPHRSGA
jgi:acetylornithine/succinyldiaminopimelate/putrescine aminotransferase